MLWVNKYKPKLEELYGQEQALQEIKQFITTFSEQRKNAAMVYGPSGTGKSSLVYAIASKLNYEVLEINASDYRDKGSMNSIVGSSLKQKSLFSKGKLIMIDELEGLSSKDRGAIPEISRLLETKTFPIIFITNDAWHEKIRKLRAKSVLIKFKPIEQQQVFRILKKISIKEKLKISDRVIEIIAGQCKGDARAAINDLQTFSTSNANCDINDLSCLGLREKDDTIFNALNLVFKASSASSVSGAFDSVNMELNELILWLDENLPLEYNNKALVNAYDTLSKADVFRGRIMRRQHWRFLVYVYSFITHGITLAKEAPNNNFISYKPPRRILKIWLAKQKYMKKKSISQKVARVIHCSRRQAQQDFIFIEKILAKNPEQAQKQLKLDDEELAFLER